MLLAFGNAAGRLLDRLSESRWEKRTARPAAGTPLRETECSTGSGNAAARNGMLDRLPECRCEKRTARLAPGMPLRETSLPPIPLERGCLDRPTPEGVGIRLPRGPLPLLRKARLPPLHRPPVSRPSRPLVLGAVVRLPQSGRRQALAALDAARAASRLKRRNSRNNRLSKARPAERAGLRQQGSGGGEFSWRSGSGSLGGRIPTLSGREFRGIWAPEESEGDSSGAADSLHVSGMLRRSGLPERQRKGPA